MYYSDIMGQQGRNELGKFSAKSDEHRQVRSIRLTDTAWNALGEIADSRCITRADLIEDWMHGEYFDLENNVKQLELEIKNLKNIALLVSEELLEKLNGISQERSITREELIKDLIDNYNSARKSANFVNHVQLDLLPKASDDVDMLLKNSDKANTEIHPLNNKDLSKRFNVDASNLRKQMLKGEEKFLEYSASKDPNGVSWRYSPKDKLYYPVLQ